MQPKRDRKQWFSNKLEELELKNLNIDSVLRVCTVTHTKWPAEWKAGSCVVTVSRMEYTCTQMTFHGICNDFMREIYAIQKYLIKYFMIYPQFYARCPFWTIFYEFHDCMPLWEAGCREYRTLKIILGNVLRESYLRYITTLRVYRKMYERAWKWREHREDTNQSKYTKICDRICSEQKISGDSMQRTEKEFHILRTNWTGTPWKALKRIKFQRVTIKLGTRIQKRTLFWKHDHWVHSDRIHLVCKVV